MPSLAWLLALALSAWIAAGWYWRIAGTRPERSQYAALTDPLAAAREVSSHHLFGTSTQSGADSPVASVGQFRLLGVAANSGKSPGFAVLQEAGLPSISVVEGEDIAPGVKLLKVLPQSVELSRNGARETLRLSDAGNTPPLPVATGGIDSGVNAQPSVQQQTPATVAPSSRTLVPAGSTPASAAPSSSEE
ncbi:MAG TPA: type II secretion system protein N [Rhodocyclaceae bacterium]|nr:type II secretion system protein N [Rhodocyclaceae bacterium]